MTLQEFKNEIRNNLFEKLKDQITFLSYDIDKLNASLNKVNSQIALESNNHMLFFERSSIYWVLEDFEMAIQDSLKGVEILKRMSIENTGLLFYVNLAIMFNKAYDFKNALHCFDSILKLNPKYAEAFFYRGFVHLNMNKLNEAISDWTNALKLKTLYSDECCTNLEMLKQVISQLKEPIIFIDNRDGQEYRIINIGGQIWMADNLNYALDGSTNYDIQTVLNGKKYGRYYTFEQARKACPSGWHIPTENDFDILIKNMGGQMEAGHKLLEGRESGFETLLLGYRLNNEDSISGSDYFACFWVDNKEMGLPKNFVLSDENSLKIIKNLKKSSPSNVYKMFLSQYYSQVLSVNVESANILHGINVRCIKD